MLPFLIFGKKLHTIASCGELNTLKDIIGDVGWLVGTRPDSDDVDLHGHQQSVQHHQQGGDAEPQVLRSHVVLGELAQLDGLCDERQHPVDEQDCEQKRDADG